MLGEESDPMWADVEARLPLWQEVSFENLRLSDGRRVNGRRVNGKVTIEER